MDTNKIDVDALFKQYSIKEIQAIELQVKNEIEKKKEDLRIMVYNRYRDIIDAADGIHVMKNCSHQIETVLKDLQGTCENVFSGKENPEFVNECKQRLLEKTKRNNKYVLAVIIKILQNSPSKIWYHLDNHDYLKAAKQYLIAQNAHICLETEKSLKTQESSSVYIQYANELWNSIVFLSHTIVSKSRATLVGSDKNVSSKVLIDAMSAIYLLENNSSLKKLFQEFVSSRTKIICASIDFDPNDTASSINERIVGCLKTFVCTVFHFYDLFSLESDNKSESFESLINDMSFTIETLKDDGVVVNKIPVYLKNIKFKDTEQVKRFDAEFLVKNATQWLDSCLSELKTKVATTFKYANNLKNLVLIRDSVLQFELSLLNNSAVSPAITFNSDLSWEKLCSSLFNQKIPIWSGLISQFYYSQSKFIIETLFQTTHENLIKSLKECLINIANEQRTSSELDINSYLWSADISNILNASASSGNSVSGSQEKHQINFFSNQSTLRLSRQHSSSFSLGKPGQNYSTKQHTTPSIAKLCRQLDEDLARLIGDIEFSTSSSLNDQQSSSSSPDFNIATILSVDLNNFNDYLQESLLSFGNNMCGSLMGLIEKLNSGETVGIPSSSGRKFSLTETLDLNLNVKQILLICRLAHAIPFNCPSLKLCFINLNQQLVQQQRQQLMRLNSQETAQNNSVVSSYRKTTQQTDQKIVSDENWIKQTNRFRDILKVGFNILIQSLCNEVEEKYLKNLLNYNLNQNVNPLTLDELIAWDEIDIEEELGSNMTDDVDSTKPTTTSNKGESFKSKLNVPSVCSAFIQSILYSISQQLTKNLSYTMIDSNLILKKLILSIFDLILRAYRNLLERQNDATSTNRIKLTQNQSLQFLFDLKFLATLFDLKSLQYAVSSVATGSNDDNLTKLLGKVADEYKSLCADLEALIDPFDYDICLPFIQSNVSKSITRSVALYGIISINEKQLKSSNTVNTTSASEKFNLLVLSNNQQRFELLPLASQQSLNQQAQMQQMQFKNQISMKYDDGMKRNLSKPSSADTGSASGGIFGFKWF